GGAQRVRGLLVRQGDVGARAAGGGECVERAREFFRRGIDRLVAQGDAGLAAEGGEDARRKGVPDGMAENRVQAAHVDRSLVDRPTSLLRGADQRRSRRSTRRLAKAS